MHDHEYRCDCPDCLADWQTYIKLTLAFWAVMALAILLIGLAWAKTDRMTLDSRPLSSLRQAGATLDPPETRRAAPMESAIAPQTRTAATKGDAGTVQNFPRRRDMSALRFLDSVGAGASLDSMIDAAAHLCGVPPTILHRLVARESSRRQWDRRGRTLRSSVGALGLTQIKLGSAREISPTLNIHTRWGNLLAGACYLSKHRRGGSWERALHRYRLGPYHRVTTQVARDYAADILGSAQ